MAGEVPVLMGEVKLATAGAAAQGGPRSSGISSSTACLMPPWQHHPPVCVHCCVWALLTGAHPRCLAPLPSPPLPSGAPEWWGAWLWDAGTWAPGHLLLRLAVLAWEVWGDGGC